MNKIRNKTLTSLSLMAIFISNSCALPIITFDSVLSQFFNRVDTLVRNATHAGKGVLCAQ